VYELPDGFSFWQSDMEGDFMADMDISSDSSLLVVPVIDSSNNEWLFLLLDITTVGQLIDTCFVEADVSSWDVGCRPRFDQDGDRIFFNTHSHLLVWDLSSGNKDTLFEFSEMGFLDLLPGDMGFLYRDPWTGPIRAYRFADSSSTDLPGTDSWTYMEVNPAYGEYAVAWSREGGRDTVLLLYNLSNYTYEQKALSPYHGGNFIELTWSPDGNDVAFSYFIGGVEDPTYELWIYRNIKDFY